jgi:glycosyltransferase involved in cell wall biosynthesis
LELPSISIVIPTRNSERTLEMCLRSIAEQDYPRERMKLVIVDAFSSDKTVEIAKGFDAEVLINARVTGEAGKAVGVKAANGELLAFVDSDNILASKSWLMRMVKPLIDDSEVVASEPIFYSYSSRETFIVRYCSLIGADDPLSIYLGFYGRYSYLTGRWTDIPMRMHDKGPYYEVTLNPGVIPTMGANGFLIRANALKRTDYYPYLFDIDIIYDLVDLGYNKFARVKTDIFHLYAFSLTQYIRKTFRRIRDYYIYHAIGLRRYPWTRFDKIKLLKFLWGVLVIIPLVNDAIKGYKRKPDTAWFLHWFICVLTVLVYATKEFSSGFYLLRKSLALHANE